MVSEEEFVENFIDNCIDNGTTKPKDICEKALARIDIIDQELQEYRDLRIEKQRLIKVLKAFNHEGAKNRGRRPRAPMINPDVEINDDPSYKDVLAKICDIVEHNSPIEMRELTEKTGYDLQDVTPLYTAVKWLFNRGILSRQENRALVKGTQWENRPK